MDSIGIRPARNVAGSLRLPGDKSISHRYAMLAGIADGCSTLENFATGADCASTLACMEALGCEVERRSGKETGATVVDIEGEGPRLRAPSGPLDCGNSGSTIRMLSGIVAGQDFTCEMVGDASLSRRPMARIMQPLRQMGAEITANNDRPPLRIRGGKLRAINYTLPVASAQVKTCVLFAGLLAEGTTEVEEPLRTRDHGEVALRAFGATVGNVDTRRLRIHGGQKLRPIHAVIPGDISTAAFFLCAAALFPDSNLVFENLLLNPTRAALLDVLRSLGLQISVLHVAEQHGELAGAIQARYGGLAGLKIAGAASAALIDELPVLAAIAPYTREGIDVRDARELRVKESDRIAAVAANLRAMGAEVEEREDGLRVPGNQRLHGAELQSFDDHRIAMAFTIAALRAEGDSVMHGADAARISFPEFYSTLEKVVER
ncbi:MAG: 3-phosphoshikimate 1-carboxyvinyltransferase [Terriglobales bacterium]